MLKTYRRNILFQPRLHPPIGVLKTIKSLKQPSSSSPKTKSDFPFFPKPFSSKLNLNKVDSIIHQIFPQLSLQQEKGIDFDMLKNNISSTNINILSMFITLLPQMQIYYLLIIQILLKFIDSTKEKLKVAQLDYFQNTLDVSYVTMLSSQDNDKYQNQINQTNEITQYKNNIFYSIIENKMNLMNIETFMTIEYLFNKKSILNLILVYLLELFPLIMFDKINVKEKIDFISSLSTDKIFSMFNLFFDNRLVGFHDKRKKENKFIQTSILKHQNRSIKSFTKIKSHLPRSISSIKRYGGFKKKHKTNKKKKQYNQFGGIYNSNLGAFISFIILLMFSMYMFTSNENKFFQEKTDFSKRQLKTLATLYNVSEKLCNNFQNDQECSIKPIFELKKTPLTDIEEIINVEQTLSDKLIVLANPFNHIESLYYTKNQSQYSKHQVPILIPKNISKITNEICVTLNSHIRNISNKEIYDFHEKMPFLQQVLKTMKNDYLDIKSNLNIMKSKKTTTSQHKNFLKHELNVYKEKMKNHSEFSEQKFINDYFKVFNLVLKDETQNTLFSIGDTIYEFFDKPTEYLSSTRWNEIYNNIISSYSSSSSKNIKSQSIPNNISYEELFDLLQYLFDEIMRIEFLYDAKTNQCKVLNKYEYVDRFKTLITLLNKNIILFKSFVIDTYENENEEQLQDLNKKSLVIELFINMYDRANYLNMIIEHQSTQDKKIVDTFSRNLYLESENKEEKKRKPYFEILNNLDKTIYSRFLNNLLVPTTNNDFENINFGEELTKKLLIEVEIMYRQKGFVQATQIPLNLKRIFSSFKIGQLNKQDLQKQKETIDNEIQFIVPQIEDISHIRLHNAYIMNKNTKIKEWKIFQSYIPNSLIEPFSAKNLIYIWNFLKTVLINFCGFSLEYLANIEEEASKIVSFMWHIYYVGPTIYNGGIFLVSSMYYLLGWFIACLIYIFTFPVISLLFAILFWSLKYIFYFIFYMIYKVGLYPITQGTKMALEKMKNEDETMRGSKMFYTEFENWRYNCKHSESWLVNIVKDLKKNIIQNILKCKPIHDYRFILNEYKNLKKKELSFDIKNNKYYEFRKFIVNFIRATEKKYIIDYESRSEFSDEYPSPNDFSITLENLIQQNEKDNLLKSRTTDSNVINFIEKQYMNKLIHIWIQKFLKDNCPHLNILLLTKEKNKHAKEKENVVVLDEDDDKYEYKWNFILGHFNSRFNEKFIHISNENDRDGSNINIEFLDTIPILLDLSTGNVSFFFSPSKTNFQFNYVCEQEEELKLKKK